MQKFTTISSKIAPFAVKDIDTDVIIPAQYLTSTSRAGFGEHLFERVKASDAQFFMNKPEFTGAQILAVGENFGCGSSREHAVWALMSAGFRVILGTTFADIFSGNAAKSGLLLARLAPEEMEKVFAASREGQLSASVDLEKQSVTLSDGTVCCFPYDPFRKSCLLNGYDDLDYLLSNRSAIESHFSGKEPVRL